METQNHTAALEKSLAISYKFKYTPYDQQVTLNHLREMKTHVH